MLGLVPAAVRLPAAIGGKGFAEGGPTADVEPLDGQGDGGDVGGFFHDGDVDGALRERGVDVVEHFGLAGVPQAAAIFMWPS